MATQSQAFSRRSKVTKKEFASIWLDAKKLAGSQNKLCILLGIAKGLPAEWNKGKIHPDYIEYAINYLLLQKKTFIVKELKRKQTIINEREIMDITLPP